MIIKHDNNGSSPADSIDLNLPKLHSLADQRGIFRKYQFTQVHSEVCRRKLEFLVKRQLLLLRLLLLSLKVMVEDLKLHGIQEV